MKRLNTFYFALIMMLMVFVSIETGWAQPVEQNFNFTGGQQSFVVPDGVNSVHVQAWGAQGGMPIQGVPAGLGGFAEGDLAVTPGQTLEIFVGGQGCVQFNGTGCGGFNGGGDARSISNEPEFSRGGGGGASDIRVGGTTLNDRVIVAAGGGGACEIPSFPGGNGGGLNGSDGGNTGGGGGQQNNGGAGFSNCTDGQFGLGGNAASPFTCAGGGAGWYGGGSSCGGGGGSSFIDGVANGNTTAGVREGDGMVVLTFTPFIPNVPTLSQWGLIAMAGILGIVGFMVIRRRKVTA